MAMKDLTAFERKLYEFIRDGDYGNEPWVTVDVAKLLGTTDENVYNALSELTRKIKDNVWVHYSAGVLHVVAD